MSDDDEPILLVTLRPELGEADAVRFLAELHAALKRRGIRVRLVARQRDDEQTH